MGNFSNNILNLVEKFWLMGTFPYFRGVFCVLTEGEVYHILPQAGGGVATLQTAGGMAAYRVVMRTGTTALQGGVQRL